MVTLNAMKDYEKEMIEIRRDLHAHPELGFELPRTSSIVARKLLDYGYSVETDMVPCGVIGTLSTGLPGKTIMVRADMDALAMEDKIETEYRSQIPGRGHKCGHDAHTALMLGAAHYMADHREGLCGTFKVLFQPSEESGPHGGAERMVQAGAIEGVDAMFGLHMELSCDVGDVAVKYGTKFAGTTMLKAEISGVGGHGAYPHRCKDPIVTACEIVNAAQTLVSRATDPAKSYVVTFGSIKGGDAGNVIPDKVYLTGTTRALDQETMDRNTEMLENIFRHISEMNGCTYELHNDLITPVMVNETQCTKVLEDAAVDVLGREHVIVQDYAEMGGDDFAYYAQKVPASYFFVGFRNVERGIVHDCHSPNFDIDENALAVGAAVIVRAAENYLR